MNDPYEDNGIRYMPIQYIFASAMWDICVWTAKFKKNDTLTNTKYTRSK